MGSGGLAAALLVASALAQAAPARKPATPADWQRRLGDPRNAVLGLLVSALIFGGGRKLRQSIMARRSVRRLESPGVSPASIEESVQYGRAVLTELFRLLSAAENRAIREAAGHALTVLWAKDELIAEEEKAIVTRGFEVDWRARKHYPRALTTEIPIVVTYQVSFLRDGTSGVRPASLNWSHRVEGSRRTSLERFSSPTPGIGRASFTIVPSDFTSNGPHRLVLQPRVTTSGLTESWTIDLPHIPFTFEFDPLLAVDALLTLPDESRAAAFAQSVRLVASASTEPSFLGINSALSLRNPPEIEISRPLPCDLAHAIEVAFDDTDGWHSAGELIVSGQTHGNGLMALTHRHSIGPIIGLSPDAIDRPGVYHLKTRLLARPERGWGDPDVRSVWPGTIDLGTTEVEIVRR